MDKNNNEGEVSQVQAGSSVCGDYIIILGHPRDIWLDVSLVGGALFCVLLAMVGTGRGCMV